jgi:hypothetical protein
MPNNATTCKVKWLPPPTSDVSIDLVYSDDDDHSQQNDYPVAMIATGDNDEEDNDDYEQVEVENAEDHNFLDEVVDSNDEHSVPWSLFLAT